MASGLRESFEWTHRCERHGGARKDLTTNSFIPGETKSQDRQRKNHNEGRQSAILERPFCAGNR